MNELTHHIFELLLYKIGIIKSILIPWSFPIILRKTMLHIWCKLLFIYWFVFDGKKMEANAMNKLSEIIICIKF